MRPQDDIERVATQLLATNSFRLVTCRPLQSLWAGYGHVCHVIAAPLPAAQSTSGEDNQPSQHTSFILKYIVPPSVSPDSILDEGHIRKLLSYQVELDFYTQLAPQLPPDVAVATCHASLISGTTTTPNAEFKTCILLTDLRPAFPVSGEKRSTLTETQVLAALKWLAGFHGFWWSHARAGGDGILQRANLVRPPLQHLQEHGSAVLKSQESKTEHAPARVWLNGGYTYLATRRGEYANLCEEESEWSEALCQPIEGVGLSVAEIIAQALAPRTQPSSSAATAHLGLSEYETLIHGDVKSENLFTNTKGDIVAFFDFQYVGLGLGVCDLAKLFTCSVPRSMLGKKTKQGQLPMSEGEEGLLRVYLENIQESSGISYSWEVFVRHWETALVDWLRFQASWGFWGNTEWLEGRVRSILADTSWMNWLRASST
ncbi:unnamed protein product [Discula destructiva]